MTTEGLTPTVVVSTELGDVEVSLAPGEGWRKLCFRGSQEACEYVAMLFATSYGYQGRLLGNSCTESEFEHVVTHSRLAELVRWRD
jgi:hypothetical protein